MSRKTTPVSNTLTQSHPVLMVPHVYTFSVVLYTNGNAPSFSNDALRDALIAALPPGTGVSGISCTNHGVYVQEKDGA